MYKSCENEYIIDDTYKSYTILAEIYKRNYTIEKDYLWGYIVQNHRGRVFEVSARELEKWN